MIGFFLFFLMAAATNGASTNSFEQTRTFGGHIADIETFPYTVSINFDSILKCGGSIISNQWILTASNCFTLPVKLSLQHFTIRAGSSYSNRGGTVHHPAKIILHPNFKYEKFVPVNDIALIKLKEPIVYDVQHRAIELFNQYEKSETGDDCVEAGWGLARYGFSHKLNYVNIPIVSMSVCKTAYEKKLNASDNQICGSYYYYGESRKVPCIGDSGGPLVINNRQAGIISWGNRCGVPEFPSVYTEVASYREWISKTMASN